MLNNFIILNNIINIFYFFFYYQSNQKKYFKRGDLEDKQTQIYLEKHFALSKSNEASSEDEKKFHSVSYI
jgi:hypothetical protein